ncbi:hypothetical protein [Xenorhabdus sp. KJ12.1]|uniref:hypothetical protein n=1 Tax=Xenorhabdus sp. KJ12.1 TaxID=1851571 RepID=UPI000C04A717|nr:hypothetical protein [Xenorhabdus sp. KJ12.1]PHM68337.1 hypothetical protein Xekj_03386 [Xenorhabdus sp. KJ12.1]
MNFIFKKIGITFTDKWNSSDIAFTDLFKATSYKGGYTTPPYSYLLFKEKKRSIRNNLQDDIEIIWKGLKKNTRNEINKISQQNPSFELNKIPEENFIIFYNKFVEDKKLNLPLMSKERLRKYKDNITYTSTTLNNNWCSIHVYLCIGDYVELLYSITNSEMEYKITGMINRFHHWNDFKFLKENKFNTYDWGGIAFGELDGISKFKFSFGGYETIYPIYYSPLYFITLFFKRIIKNEKNN